MPQDRTRKIVVAGVLGAISIFLSLTPLLGFIPWFSGVSLTTMHIPVIIGAVLEGPVVGLVVGLIFGVFSMIRAAVAPNGPFDLLFLNPLISVLPRLLIGPAAWLAWKWLKRWPALGLVTAGAVGSLTNSFLVLGMIGLLATLGVADVSETLGSAFWGVIGTIFVANSLPEALVSAILVLLILGFWFLVRVGRRKGSRVS